MLLQIREEGICFAESCTACLLPLPCPLPFLYATNLQKEEERRRKEGRRLGHGPCVLL